MKKTTLPLHRERAEYLREYLIGEDFIYSIELTDGGGLIGLTITYDNDYADVLSLRLFHAGLQFSTVKTPF